MPARALKRILLVEDDPDLREIVALSLRSLGGFTVRACTSARECVAVAVDFHPDLVLLDVVMPGMNGLAAARALRDKAATATTPIVFLTAKAVDPAEAGLAPLAVISKPFKATALPDTLLRIWSEAHAQAD